MEDLERFGSLSDVMRAGIQAELRGVFTALPVLVTSSDQHVAAHQPAVNGLVRQDDGTMQQLAMPELQTSPVHFAGGGKVVSTHPVKAGDEGIAVFSARPIDSWHQSGGQQNAIDARIHSLSDHFYIPGVKSDPNTIPNKAPDSIQHRSVDGTVTHDVHPDNGTTTKVVDPSDTSGNPFSLATIFHATTHNALSGIVKVAKDALNNHSLTLNRLTGLLTSVVTGSSAAHTMNLTPSGGFQATASNPSAGTMSSISASPSGVLSLAASSGLSLPAGGVSSGALASGAASSNVGALGGDLSGSLPNPHVVGATGLPVYASNAAATAGGLPVGRLYANNTISGSEYVVCVVH